MLAHRVCIAEAALQGVAIEKTAAARRLKCHRYDPLGRLRDVSSSGAGFGAATKRARC